MVKLAKKGEDCFRISFVASFRFLSALICGVCLLGFSNAQESAPAKKEEPKIYLRIANLLPIGTPAISLKIKDEILWCDMNPGFLMPYLPLENAGTFHIMQGDTPLENFTIKKEKEDVFYSAVVYAERQGSIKVLCNLDSAPEGEKLATQRFRGYFGGFDFPYRVDAGTIGTWDVPAHGGLCVSIELVAEAPETISVIYRARDNNMVTVHFPLGFKETPQYSAFVSQRGVRRPRVTTAPDNIPPRE